MKMILRIIKIIIGIFFILISIAGVVSLVEEGFEMLGFVLTIVFMFSGVVLNLSAFKNKSIKESLQKNKVLNLSSRIILSCCIGLVFIGILLPGDKVDDMANDPASVDSSYESEFLSSNENQDSEIDVGESQVLNDDSDDEEEKESENPQAYVVVSDTKKSYEDTETSKDISISDNPEPIKSYYVGNSDTRKFHKSSCASAKKISSHNRVEFSSYDEAINSGYSGCKRCNPR